MKRNLRIHDITLCGERDLIEPAVEDLAPLPPPYDAVEEQPAWKSLTDDQKSRLVCNLDGFIGMGLPRPESPEQEKRVCPEVFLRIKEAPEPRGQLGLSPAAPPVAGLLRAVPDLRVRLLRVRGERPCRPVPAHVPLGGVPPPGQPVRAAVRPAPLPVLGHGHRPELDPHHAVSTSSRTGAPCAGAAPRPAPWALTTP